MSIKPNCRKWKPNCMRKENKSLGKPFLEEEFIKLKTYSKESLISQENFLINSQENSTNEVFFTC